MRLVAAYAGKSGIVTSDMHPGLGIRDFARGLGGGRS
jgi:hypothetical protein